MEDRGGARGEFHGREKQSLHQHGVRRKGNAFGVMVGQVIEALRVDGLGLVVAATSPMYQSSLSRDLKLARPALSFISVASLTRPGLGTTRRQHPRRHYHQRGGDSSTIDLMEECIMDLMAKGDHDLVSKGEGS